MSEDSISPPILGHPTGITFDIVGIERGDQGRTCDEHEDACGSAVLKEDAEFEKFRLLQMGKRSPLWLHT